MTKSINILPETKKCERCNGRGIISILGPGGGFSLNPGNRMNSKQCPSCGGTGIK